MSKQQENFSFAVPVKNGDTRARLNSNAGFYWCTEKKLSLALSRLAIAMDDAGYDEDDFEEPVRVNFPVEDDIPAEGVFDMAFCRNRELGGTDGKTLVIIPDADELAQEKPQPKSWPELTEVAKLPLRRRILAQLMAEDDYLYHVDKEQMAAILRLESDSQNTFAQTFTLAAENVEQIEIAVGFDIFRAAKAYKQLFPVDGKKPELATVTQFLTEYFGAECINRSMIVSEWAERLHNKHSHDAKLAEPFVDFSKLSAETQNAVLVKYSVCENITADMVTDAHDLLQESMSSFEGHIVEALGKTPEINSMYPERKLLAIGWVKYKCKSNAKWPEIQTELRNWKKRQDAERKETGPSKSVIDIARARVARQENRQNTENVATDINPDTAAVRREYKQTWKTLDEELAIAFWAGDVKPGMVDERVLRWAKTEVIGKDRDDWKRFSASLRKHPDALRFNLPTVFGLVRERPDDIHRNPVALNQYISEYLKTNGVFEDEESDQNAADTLQPSVPKTDAVEATTSNDEKAEVQMEAEPSVERDGPFYFLLPDGEKYGRANKLAGLNKALAVGCTEISREEYMARKNGTFKAAEENRNINDESGQQEQSKVTVEDVNKIMAAARGEYVEGISDPNDQKWIPGIQILDTASQSEPETEQIKSESKQNEPGQESHNEMPKEVKAIPQAPKTMGGETGETTNPLVLMSEDKINHTTSRMWYHLMIDLETMGTNCNAPIVVISAVFFDPQTGEIGPAFYKVISLVDAMKSGATPDAETIEWWLKQSSEARSAILVDQIPLDDALLQLREFIDENSDEKFIKVWGNGATFDNVILRRSYERQEIPCPWRYYNDRDVRTIVELGKNTGFDAKTVIPFEGVRHNALDDARHQVKYVSAIWQKLIPNQADF
ncbi:TPA: 3'-5' exoribonuclease [Citrobacter freundii]